MMGHCCFRRNLFPRTTRQDSKVYPGSFGGAIPCVNFKVGLTNTGTCEGVFGLCSTARHCGIFKALWKSQVEYDAIERCNQFNLARKYTS